MLGILILVLSLLSGAGNSLADKALTRGVQPAEVQVGTGTGH
jgi:hypothetical protein